jgi:hypothetical protein
MHFATFEVIPMRRDHRMLSQPVAVVAFTLAFAVPAGAADLLPYEEGCSYGCGGQPYAYGAQPYAGQAYGGQPYGAQPYDPYDSQPYGGQPYGGQPYAAQPYGGQPYGQPYAGGQPYAAQPYGGQPYGGQPYGGQSYGGQPYGGQPYAAPAIGPNNGYGPSEEQYDEPVEQGDGSPVY